jgi:hypothetical protein
MIKFRKITILLLSGKVGVKFNEEIQTELCTVLNCVGTCRFFFIDFVFLFAYTVYTQAAWHVKCWHRYL